MKQIIIIRGGDCFPTQELFYKSLKEWDFDPFLVKKSRKERIAQATSNEYQTIIPNMPNKQNADYNAWKIRFERHFDFISQEETILVGHSLGGIFLAKRLSENIFPKKISQLHLVSACFDDEGMIEEGIGNFEFDVNKLKNISPQVENIYLYHSKDDDIVPFENSQKFNKYLPIEKFEIFENRGHINQETFPELLENIKSHK